MGHAEMVRVWLQDELIGEVVIREVWLIMRPDLLDLLEVLLWLVLEVLLLELLLLRKRLLRMEVHGHLLLALRVDLVALGVELISHGSLVARLRCRESR